MRLPLPREGFAENPNYTSSSAGGGPEEEFDVGGDAVEGGGGYVGLSMELAILLGECMTQRFGSGSCADSELDQFIYVNIDILINLEKENIFLVFKRYLIFLYLDT